jgi:hypothetical protein
MNWRRNSTRTTSAPHLTRGRCNCLGQAAQDGDRPGRHAVAGPPVPGRWGVRSVADGGVGCHPPGALAGRSGRGPRGSRGLFRSTFFFTYPLVSFWSVRKGPLSPLVPSLAERGSGGPVPAVHEPTYYARLTILTQPADRGTQSGVQRPHRSQYFPRRPNSSTPGRREPCRPPRRQCGHGSACRLPSSVTRMALNATSIHTHPCEVRDDHTGGVL